MRMMSEFIFNAKPFVGFGFALRNWCMFGVLQYDVQYVYIYIVSTVYISMIDFAMIVVFRHVYLEMSINVTNAEI